MRLGWQCGLVVWVGCAPPPEIDVQADTDDEVEEASIQLRILHPARDVGTIALDPDGALTLFVVVDINGLEFVPPDVEPEDVEGHGHWHLYLNNDYLGPPGREFAEYRSPIGEFGVGQAMSLQAVVATNSHDEIDGAHPDAIDTIEFTVAAAAGL